MKIDQIAPEFDLRSPGLGFTMNGWEFTRAEIAEAIKGRRLLNPAFELASNRCPWNCFFCFTSPPESSKRKRVLPGEMPLERRLELIDEAAALGTRSINVVGAGEPTIDPYFWDWMEHIVDRSITPILYTEGAMRLTDRRFVDRLQELGATVVLKVNSLWNRTYQNDVVLGVGDNRIRHQDDYFRKRNQALATLLAAGFNTCEPTRLAFDTILCRQNQDEIEQMHRWARERNIFILLVNYLPSGRSSSGIQDAMTREEQFRTFQRLAEIDETEFGLSHRSHFPYAGGVPCTIRGLGLFVKITGAVYDCPGESKALGSLKDSSLNAIWNRAKEITGAFDGGCLPRRLYWEHQNGPSRR